MNLINVPMNHPTFAGGHWHDARWQHHRVMELFGDLGGGGDARANGQVLYRVEPELAAWDGSSGRVLVQSSVRPSVDGVRVTDLGQLLEHCTTGTTVRLMLRANTVRTINRTGSDGRERRHRARIPDDHLAGWLRDRLRGAAELESSVRIEPGQLRLGRAQLITTTFHADATVDDADRFRRLVVDGIGRAKSYGCGMLSALPLR